ncbi:DUF6985 domain-containing protein [Chitinophaga sp. YR627]|uniref:DUF6985 domain-containing protein n=1 Tax=Chitinophaga sp. YR627 TaxID=1881041 RepID=UPI000B7CBBDA|nr:hypothetical protein [Chitinophaga sp. YR627]
MKASTYIQHIQFNKVRLFHRKYQYHESYILDKGERSEWVRSSDEKLLINSILDHNGDINPSFVEITTPVDVQQIQSVFDIASVRYFPGGKYPCFDAAIIFAQDSQVVGGIDVDFRNRIARTTENDIVPVSHEEMDALLNLYASLGVRKSDHYLPPSIATNGYWMHYRFPFEFFYNAAFNTFEAGINTTLMCVNFKLARLDVESIDNRITKEQISRVHEMESQSHRLNALLKAYLWELYQLHKPDYELPELTDAEQLYFFVEVSSIYVPDKEEGPISISFRTWDEEHGCTVQYRNGELKFE